MTKLQVSAIASVLLAIVAPALAQTPLGTAFTYQGRLMDGGKPANGNYNLEFRLFDADVAGNQIGAPVTQNSTPVTGGLFTLALNVNNEFGASAFNGQARWLEVSVNGQPLTPRQPVTATPNALFALNADRLDGLDSTAFLQSIPVPLTLSGTNPTSHIISGTNAATTGNSYGVYGRATGGSGLTWGVFGRSDSPDGAGIGGYASSQTGNPVGVWGMNSSAEGYAVYGDASHPSGPTTGVWGRSSSTSGRGVFGSATATSGVTYGGRFESASTAGYGVFGLATATSGQTFGLWGQSVSTGGFGVFGEQTATSGTTYGVYGRAASTDGFGVAGRASATSGITYGGYFQSDSTSGRGVFGYASAASGAPYGGYFQTQSTGGYGAFGYATATSGTTYGLFGQSDSTTGRGVYGLATAASGDTYGVYGRSDSTDGRGVFGSATAGSGSTLGGRFENASTSGRGVGGYATAATGLNYGTYGQCSSTSGRAVYGWASATGASDTPYGVTGSCSTATLGYAVYALGDMGASGTKSFRIDHPSDPENKYLLHYAAESPEVINFYSGKVTLDGRGEAVVELPAYFAGINKDPRYLLTAVGAPMPMLHVAEEISDEALTAGEQAGPGIAPPTCWFRIAGGAPGAKVSWEVKALRNDLRVRMHGAPVEREKTGLERGKYQHPEYYGRPPEMGMDYDAGSADSPVRYQQPDETGMEE